MNTDSSILTADELVSAGISTTEQTKARTTGKLKCKQVAGVWVYSATAVRDYLRSKTAAEAAAPVANRVINREPITGRIIY